MSQLTLLYRRRVEVKRRRTSASGTGQVGDKGVCVWRGIQRQHTRYIAVNL